MLCLGIETSCDETALALLDNGKVIAELTASQERMHSLFGGVVPELASREHYRKLWTLFERIKFENSISAKDLDLISVARGPGLLGSLLVGLGFAKGLALSTKAGLIGVDHLHAHLMAAELEYKVDYPALGLLVSGGHTQLYYMRSSVDLELLGRTLDDAVGEAFDKTAQMLNLPYPGGVHIDRLARDVEPDLKLFPSPYLDNQNLDFSFSGLKTAVKNYLEKHPEIRLPKMSFEPNVEFLRAENRNLCMVCASFNYSVAKALQKKTERALNKFKDAKSLVMAGGVAANSMIREFVLKLADKFNIPAYLPSKGHCTDNAGMIAYTGSVLYKNGFFHDLDLDAVPRGKAVPWDYVRSEG